MIPAFLHKEKKKERRKLKRKGERTRGWMEGIECVYLNSGGR